MHPQAYPDALLDLRIPALIKPTQIPAYIDSFTQNKVPVMAVIEPLDNSSNQSTYGRTERLNDFVQRIVLARSANPRAVLIDLPMVRRAGLGGQRSEPDELLLVYRTLIGVLGNAQYKGEMSLMPGVRAFLFDRQGIGTIVLWNEHAEVGEVTLSLALGKNPLLLDFNGSATPVPVKDGIAALTVTSAPLILDNIDPKLTQLRGSFALGVNVVPAGLGILETTVGFQNPYDEALTGSLHLQAPPGWTCDPPTIKFTLQPRAKLSEPIKLRYPFSEFAGRKILKAQLTLDPDTRSMDLLSYLTVASDQVDITCLATFMPTGEWLLQETVTNLAGTPLNAQAYAMIPEMPRQQRYVLDLKPGQSVVKRFVFPNAQAATGKIAVLGLRLTDGQTLMTKSLPLN